MSKKKKYKKLEKVQIHQEDFTSEVFDKKLRAIRNKIKKGKNISLKADELLYEVLADCYILSAEFSDKESDEACQLLEDMCNQSEVKYDEIDKQRTLLRLVYGGQYKKGSPERKKENARIATYARALNNMAGKNIGLDEAKNKLKEFGIDWWANRDKGDEVDTPSKNQKPLSEQTLKFFGRHNVRFNSVVFFVIGKKVFYSNDDELLGRLKKDQKDGKYQFGDINEFNKEEGQ